MPKVFILCGKIASGKTTYANLLCEEANAMNLSIDDVMLKLYDNCLGPEKHRKVMEQITAYFLTLIPQIFHKGCSVVLDYGYWTKSERDWIKEQCKNAAFPYEVHYLEIEEEIRLNRLHDRNLKNMKQIERQYIIQDELQKRLDARFEIPNKDEYDKKITL